MIIELSDIRRTFPIPLKKKPLNENKQEKLYTLVNTEDNRIYEDLKGRSAKNLYSNFLYRFVPDAIFKNLSSSLFAEKEMNPSFYVL